MLAVSASLTFFALQPPSNIKMSNAENGARIKAWAGQGVGSGIVKNITFSMFTETNVDNPVIIDQASFIRIGLTSDKLA